MAQTIASRGFSRLPLYFTEESRNDKGCFNQAVAMPPLSSMGLTCFAEFEGGNFDGITYIDTVSKANPFQQREHALS